MRRNASRRRRLEKNQSDEKAARGEGRGGGGERGSGAPRKRATVVPLSQMARNERLNNSVKRRFEHEKYKSADGMEVMRKVLAKRSFASE